ncbi:MAG: LysE family translocator [Pseudomonadota bacterium]
MTFEALFLFTISLILLWVKPGPGQALKITTTLNSGLFAGFGIVAGIITGCLIFFTIAVTGAAFLTSTINSASLILKAVGGLYLLYIGVKGFLDLRKGVFKQQKEQRTVKNFLKNYSIGLGTNLANPLPIFFFLSIMPTLVPIGEYQLNDILIGMSIIVMVGVVVDGLLLLLVDMSKDALSDTKIISKINLVTSIGFSMIGLFLLYSVFVHENFEFSLL